MEILKCCWKCMAVTHLAQLRCRDSTLLPATEGPRLLWASEGAQVCPRYQEAKHELGTGTSATSPRGHLLSPVPRGGLRCSRFSRHITSHYDHFWGGSEAASLVLPWAVYVVNLVVGSTTQAHIISSPWRSGGCGPRQPGPPAEGTSQQSD